MKHWVRIILTILAGLVGLTSVAGGLALIFGAATGTTAGGVVPDRSYLDGSPFTSFVIPGILLTVVVGGLHLLAAVLVWTAAQSGPFVTAVAAFGLLIWIFVQMMFIPFSPLQAVYFAGGLAELGLVMLGLGLIRRTRTIPAIG